MKVQCIIQARTNSKRLPEKVLLPIGEKPLLKHILDRLKKISFANFSVVLAIPNGDDKLVNFAKENSIKFCEGDEHNVLERFFAASNDLDPKDFVIRLTADNPFLDYQILNQILNQLKELNADYIYPRGLPLGMGFEVIRCEALHSQKFYDLKEHHKEHVTTFIKENPHLYEILPVGFGPLYHPERDFEEKIPVRLTIDEHLDWEMAKKTYNHFSRVGNPYFIARDVVELYRHWPDFFSLNQNVQQKSPLQYEKN